MVNVRLVVRRSYPLLVLLRIDYRLSAAFALHLAVVLGGIRFLHLALTFGGELLSGTRIGFILFAVCPFRISRLPLLRPRIRLADAKDTCYRLSILIHLVQPVGSRTNYDDFPYDGYKSEGPWPVAQRHATEYTPSRIGHSSSYFRERRCSLERLVRG